MIAGGGADVIVDWMPSALAAREKGVPLVNIAQPFKRSGMMLTCRKDSGVKTPTDFKGQTLGVWFCGNEYPFLSWMDKLGFKTDGGADGVKVLKQGFNVDPLLQKQADCISTMTYNEYWQVIDAGMKPEQLVVFKYEDQGVATLEDGLYVLEEKLADPAMVDKLARFVKASMKGWDYADRASGRSGRDRARQRRDRRADRGAPEAHDGRDRQARRHQREGHRLARPGRLRAHGRRAALRQVRPGDHQEAGRRLDARDLGQGDGAVADARETDMTGKGAARPPFLSRVPAALCAVRRRKHPSTGSRT